MRNCERGSGFPPCSSVKRSEANIGDSIPVTHTSPSPCAAWASPQENRPALTYRRDPSAPHELAVSMFPPEVPGGMGSLRGCASRAHSSSFGVGAEAGWRCRWRRSGDIAVGAGRTVPQIASGTRWAASLSPGSKPVHPQPCVWTWRIDNQSVTRLGAVDCDRSRKQVDRATCQVKRPCAWDPSCPSPVADLRASRERQSIRSRWPSCALAARVPRVVHVLVRQVMSLSMEAAVTWVTLLQQIPGPDHLSCPMENGPRAPRPRRSGHRLASGHIGARTPVGGTPGRGAGAGRARRPGFRGGARLDPHGKGPCVCRRSADLAVGQSACRRLRRRGDR